MTINESTHAFLVQAAEMGVRPFHTYSPADCRALFTNLSKAFGPGPEIGRSEDHVIPVENGTILVRLLFPAESASGVICYLHGGGFVIGSVEDYDAFGRRLVVATGQAVALVDYRLAPEHPFPTPLEDSWTALTWLAENIDDLVGPDLAITVAGDSAGGTLAAILAIRARDRGAPDLAAQVLAYPPTSDGREFPSQTQPECQLLLSQADMDYFWGHYAPGSARTSVEAAPLAVADWAGLPRTLLLTAGHDPLRDEAIAYGTALKAAGVDVLHRHFDADMHGFLTIPALASHEEATQAVAAFLAETLPVSA